MRSRAVAPAVKQSLDERVLAVLAFHGQDGARQVALALIGLDIAEQIDGGKFLGHEVAKSQVDALDRSFGIDSLRPELIEIAHDLLKRIGALGQLSRGVRVRKECGIATARFAAMLSHKDAIDCLRFAHQATPFVIALDGLGRTGRELGAGGCGGFDTDVLERRCPHPSTYCAVPLASRRRMSARSLA